MPPAARLSFIRGRIPSLAAFAGPSNFRVQGWDPILIVSQIVSLQALHYLSLSFILPPLLGMFASPVLLSYEGGSASVSMVMDWREFLGLSITSTAAQPGFDGALLTLEAAKPSFSVASAAQSARLATASNIRLGLVRIIQGDPMRGWAVALAWIIASLVDVIYLYHLVRRPTHILDFSLTLIFNHLILTTYYSGRFPTSVFFWFIIIVSAVTQVVVAEQMCVARDMQEGFTINDPGLTPYIPQSGTPGMAYSPIPTSGDRGKEDVELGTLVKQTHNRGTSMVSSNTGPSRSGPYDRIVQEGK